MNRSPLTVKFSGDLRLQDTRHPQLSKNQPMTRRHIMDNAGGGYTLPDTDGIYTAEQAGAALDKLMAAALADSGHPYFSTNHLQHQAFVDCVNELNRVKFQDVDPRPKLQAITEDAMAEREDAQADRVARGQELAEQLQEFGYEEEIRQDISEPEVLLLQTVLIGEQGNWSAVDDILNEALIALCAPGFIREVYEEYRQIPPERPAEKMQLVRALGRWARDAGHKRLCLPPRTTQEETGGAL